MQLIKGKKFDDNHSAMVVKITEFVPHNNADKLKCAKIGAYNIITSIDAEPGLYVYFQKESCLNPNFLSYANLYRHSELNSNPGETGMFEDSGRIKVIKLRGELSEGFIIPAVKFENFITSVTNKSITLKEGMEFDTCEDGEKTFWIIKKYIGNSRHANQSSRNKGPKVKKARGIDRVIPEQFRFHYTTVVIKKCPNVINPDDIINVSEKIHGTSGISAHVLCNRPLDWKDKVVRFINDKILREPPIDFSTYDHLYASRTVIKNQYYDIKRAGTGFYGGADDEDRKFIDESIFQPILPKGWTAYYEIVGFWHNGTYIQKGYDYGCVPPKEGEKYESEKHFKVRVYRLTITNEDGNVYELTPSEVNAWCERHNIKAVDTWYEGRAGDLYPDLDEKCHWSTNFIDSMANDDRFYMEKLSPSCDNNVPHEGVVIKILGRNSEAFKLKCFRFLDKEQKNMDAGVQDIENEA